MSKKVYVPKENRPKCGIVYSDSLKESNESRYLAEYFCGQLVSTGYANVYMVGVTPDGVPGSLSSYSNKRMSYMPSYSANGKKIEIPAGDVTHAHFDVLGQCHVIIITVNSNDTKMCKEKLFSILDIKRQSKDVAVTIFAMSRGVKNSNEFKDAFSARKDIAVVECVVGFAAVPHPKNGAIVPTVQAPVIIFERLDKEIAGIAGGPCNLMECMKLEVYYRKVLTPYTWGTLLWENLHCVNMITGGSMYNTLWNKRARLLLASMMRESLLTLKQAAGGGKWMPEMLPITQWISPRTLEMWMCSPGWIFVSLLSLWDMCPPKDLVSPMQVDLTEGRITVSKSHLGELISTGKRYNVHMPVCSEVGKLLETMESGGPRKSETAYLSLLENNIMESVKSYGQEQNAKASSSDVNPEVHTSWEGFGARSLRAFRSRLYRLALYALLVLILYILFVHEHEHEELLEHMPGHLDQEIM